MTLKGEIGVVYFSDSGAIEEVIRLTSDGNSDAAIIRFPTKQWHTVVCHSEELFGDCVWPIYRFGNRNGALGAF